MRTTTVALFAALAATTLIAQEPRPQPSPKPATDQVKPAPAPKPEKGPPTPLVSVRIDVKIIDERGGQPAITKAVSLTVADRRNGFSRSSVEGPGSSNQPPSFRAVPFNVDASPFVDGNRIRLDVGIEYNSIDSSADAKQFPKLEIKQRLSVVLEDGKTMRVAQSADPLSDRRVSLEVTATILR